MGIGPEQDKLLKTRLSPEGKAKFDGLEKELKSWLDQKFEGKPFPTDNFGDLVQEFLKSRTGKGEEKSVTLADTFESLTAGSRDKLFQPTTKIDALSIPDGLIPVNHATIIVGTDRSSQLFDGISLPGRADSPELMGVKVDVPVDLKNQKTELSKVKSTSEENAKREQKDQSLRARVGDDFHEIGVK